MPRRARSWLAEQVPSAPGAAVVAVLFLAGALTSMIAGGVLPAALFSAGAVFVLVAYLATYGTALPSRERRERPR
jgi:hypothetical protein